MTFDSYRETLLSRPLEKVDCLIWLQSDWKTLAGTGQILDLLGAYADTVVILGNDGPRVRESRAPYPSDMYRMIRDHPELRQYVLYNACDNTLQQAIAFGCLAREHGYKTAIGLTVHPHIPRAALTFARWTDVDVIWRAAVGTVDAATDADEERKIQQYAGWGDSVLDSGPEDVGQLELG